MLSKSISGLELASQIKAGDLSAEEAAVFYSRRIQDHNEIINAFTWWDAEESLKAARNHSDGPFAGVPIAIKELTDVAGQPGTVASRAVRDRVPTIDSSVVSRIREAGFVLLGRTNSPEFGTLPVTENELYGSTRNPWNLDLTPGGSSGGAAAAVASGLVPIAHGSDGGGSIRIPASCCGLIGLKPARHRITKGPLISEVLHGFVTDGCLSRTVEDTAAFLDAVAAFDPYAWSNAPPSSVGFLAASRRNPGKKRIAYTLTSPIGIDSSPECQKALMVAVERIAGLGHDVFEATPDPYAWQEMGENLRQDFLAMWFTAPAYTPVSNWEHVEKLNRDVREAGLQQNSIQYVEALIRLQAFSRQIAPSWGRDFDFLLTTTLAQLPPKIGWLFEDPDLSTVDRLLKCSELCPNTGWCNVTGLPAISLPMAWTDEGIPVGIQIIGAPWGEAELLSLSGQLEREGCLDVREPPF